jgi:NAD(P)-dependent dehydrogenase (short-subunit alcohol dehydrogenase family)
MLQKEKRRENTMGAGFQFSGRTAVITGAGSGIGAALAEALAARGAHLALADVNRAGLSATAEAVAKTGVRVTTELLDVADPEAPAAYAETVKAEHGGAALLFNNAGIAVGGHFDRVKPDDFDKVLAVNFDGVVRMTRAFLPVLQTEPEGRLVNISSIFGIIAPPGQTAYSASKFAVRGFSMALAHELEGSSVGVTVVHPGGVATRIAEDAIKPSDASNAEINESLERARKALVMPPPQAADIILRGVEKRKRRVLVGRDAHILMWMERLFPTSYFRFLRNQLG